MAAGKKTDKRPVTPAKGVGKSRTSARAKQAQGTVAAPSVPKPPVKELPIIEETPQPEPSARSFPIAAIGASAGGLEALKEFFADMPTSTGIGFVVVTHLHPGHVSLLPELLGRICGMPVSEATDQVVVEPDHVYVGTPGGPLAITNGTLGRQESTASQAAHMPIDHFFRSLAADRKEHAICVVLSGTGTDGTLGMRAIKAEAGMAMVQEPPSAKYAGMPASAVATGLADYILPAAKMPRQLIAYVKGPYLRVSPPPRRVGDSGRAVAAGAGALRARTGHDFTCYKMSTIRRRIERRMNVHQVKMAEEYVRFLRENPHELDLLFSELLISVTSFFRDPEAFVALAKGPLAELLGGRDEPHTVRVWVPGCASGEEAYSIAILLREGMEKLKKRFDVQVFATDLDSRAIESARAGVYSGSITADVSETRLARYFTREDSVFRVRKEVREMLIFATQNVVKDPPFTKVDMIVCRNMLIYLDAETQRRLLPLFHYALLPGGLLFLGPSETIGGLKDLFETLDAKWRIFRRKDTVTAVHPVLELPAGPRKSDDEVVGIDWQPPLRQTTPNQVQRLLLARFVPASVTVDDRGNIVYIHGHTGAYLEPSQGQPRANVLEMAREGLSPCLAVALRQAAADHKEVVREQVRVRTNGGFTAVDLTITPLDEPEPLRGLYLLTFRPSPEPPSAKGKPTRKRAAETSREEQLQRDLQYTKESLQTTIEEMETSSEELKSTNEELQSTNEELQSTNEELETSKEEMQSLNEELTTVNAELQSKVDELARANDDMQNLLNSTQVATIFLDDKLNVKRYTERAKDLVRFIQTDVGRPLSDLAFSMDYEHMARDCAEVLRTLIPKEMEARDADGARHLIRIMPYRTAENVIDGVVITFVEIDRIKSQEDVTDKQP